MKSLIVAALLVALGATGGGTTVTVAPSNISFKQALAACSAGTLGAISIVLGHVRISEGPGVNSDIDDANPNAQSIVLSAGGGSAMAMVNASKHTVSAKNVTLASSRRVACVGKD
ncbi:MAG: hypothetical protein JO311_02085 [Candidatus Eremiobacteraeota bacterium]|nr:hypothetical protein [Candidatus Eremiobacteraeota bacterium]